VARHRFQCNHTDYEVLTTWALPPEDKATILATFFWEDRQWTEIELKTEFPDWFRAWQKQARRDTREEGPESSVPNEIPVPSVGKRQDQSQQVLRRELLKHRQRTEGRDTP
jgi:hypothetical protein